MKTYLLWPCFLLLLSVTGCAASQPVAEVNSFNDCVEAGYPILRSLPPKCITPGGEMFVDLSDKSLCVDSCGNGVCDEMVCLGDGCACAATPENCPKDCQPVEKEK